MSMLQQIQKGRSPQPPRLFIYGIEGIGKSTFAASAPKPIFIQTEDGLGQIDCDRFPLAQTFGETIQALSALYTDPHSYRTVVIDSLDWMERLIWADVAAKYGVDNIEAMPYGRGYGLALTQWRELVDGLHALRVDRGMTVILVAHAKIEKFEDPETSTYDRYSPRLHKHAAAMLTEWCDAVLFATRKIVLKIEEGAWGRERTIAVGVGKEGGERILRTVGSPGCLAKNRYDLPAELPLSWSALSAALDAATPKKE